MTRVAVNSSATHPQDRLRVWQVGEDLDTANHDRPVLCFASVRLSDAHRRWQSGGDRVPCEERSQALRHAAGVLHLQQVSRVREHERLDVR